MIQSYEEKAEDRFQDLLEIQPEAYVAYHVPHIFEMQTCSARKLPEYVPHVDWVLVCDVCPQEGTGVMRKYALWDFNLYGGVPKWKYEPSSEQYHQQVEFLLRNTHFERGYSLRYYNGEILLRDASWQDYRVLWKEGEGT